MCVPVFQCATPMLSTTGILFLRYMKRENEIANMIWKICPDDLMCPRGRGQMGSRYSLAGAGGGGGYGTRSVTSLDSIGAGDGGLKKQVFMKTFIYKVRSISRVSSVTRLLMEMLPQALDLLHREQWSRQSASTRTASRGICPASCCSN